MKEYRSSNFNYFSNEDRQKEKKKSAWKKVWFWIKIVFYVLLFGIAMTGCVQSCVVKSSNYTGNGIEFYTSKENVSPHVTTFDATHKLTKEESTHLHENKVDIGLGEKDQLYFDKNDGANFHLSHKNYKEIIDNLRSTHQGSYGAYKNWNTAIQLRDYDKKLWNNRPIITGTGENSNNYLFAVQPVEDDNAKGSYKTIYNPNEYKEWLVIDPTFNFDSNFVYDKEKNVFKINPENSKLINEGKFTSKLEVNNNRNSTPFLFDKELSYLTFSSKNDFTGFAKFRRDILETLATNTFYSDKSSYYKKALSQVESKLREANYSVDYNGFNKYLVDKIKNKKANELEFAPNVFYALKYYNKALNKYASELNFSALNQISPVKNSVIEEINNLSNDYNKINDKNSKEAVELKKKITSLNEQLRNTSRLLSPAPYSTMTVKLTDAVNIPYSGDEPQRVIHSWSDAWKLGPFYGLLVFPTAWLSAHLSTSLSHLGGWGTIIVILVLTIILRSAMLAVTFKQTVNQSKQEELKSKKAKIDAKYADFKNNKQMKARQQQEVAELYKKHGINPLDAFVTMIISLPVFIMMWRVIQSLPEFKSTVWLGLSFAETSWRRLFFSGEWQYLGLLVVVAAVQGVAQFLPQILNRKKFKERTSLEEEKALKKANRTQRIMTIVFFFITLIFSAGLQVYWIISGIWTIIQTLSIHKFKKSAYYRRKYLDKHKA
ncbi:membrane protein insertase YidC [Mycoplasmopsis agalactiae]|uniref:membrane protein insertase YidC n=1 Tax=Mycoplasmopsis agalactiae TaxID=2110 RepID=UPI00211BEDED|nr:membrane protein insertase YidC [Mycoplasmopsis agalactiae]UUM25591.1 membrane protein insertase YidC [Mycoplasmopsis agalactiae]